MALCQFFTVAVPLGGVSTVALDGFYLYFNSISNTAGIDFHIREVANGVPTYNVVKNSRKTIRPTDTFANGMHILQTSTDSSAFTQLLFQKPVALKTQATYALMIMPHQSDPNYKVFTATTPKNDLLTGLPISFRPSIGPLFFWEVGDQTSIANKSIKFAFLHATAHNARQHDDNYNFNEEHIIVNGFTSPFVTGETCYMSNSNFNILSANVFTGTSLTTGENFYQNDGSGTISYGKILFCNSSVVYLNTTAGTVANNIPLNGVTSGYQIWIGAVNSGVVCSNTSNSISVPFAANTLFYANQSIYLTKADTSQSQVFIVTGVSGNTVQLSWKPSFSDTGCSIGQIRGDNLGLRMNYQGYNEIKQSNFVANFENSTANTQINQYYHFANSAGTYIFGQSSRARCTSYGTIDLEYHCVIPQLHYDQIPENQHYLYWGGYWSYKAFNSTYPDAWRYITSL